jgi:hypothetical protein
VAKKRVTSRKSVRKAKPKARAASSRGDRSRLDLKPLQDHIRRRIKELEQGKAPARAARRVAESNEDTIARLRGALETLEDICHPAMDIPI